MAKAFIFGMMEACMMGNGLRTKSVEKVYMYGLMVVDMKDNGKMEDNMEKDCIGST